MGYPSVVLLVSKSLCLRRASAAPKRFLWHGCHVDRHLRFSRPQGWGLAWVVGITLSSAVQANTGATGGGEVDSFLMLGIDIITSSESASVQLLTVIPCFVFLFIMISFHKKDSHLRDITQTAVLIAHYFKCHSCSQSEAVDKAFHSSDAIDRALCIDQIKK